MLYQLPAKSSPQIVVATKRQNPGNQRRERLRQQIASQRRALESLIREQASINPELSASACSLLLYLEGLHSREIARQTGLTPDKVMRVRRRFTLLGLNCITESPSIQSIQSGVLQVRSVNPQISPRS